ncbi:hypothetical protein EPO15_10215 [bacterium]|nr:MAG: hypothetical protein EPO15_10215 [bacterium]
MTGRRDAAWALAAAAAFAALLGPALLDPGRAVANFGDLYGYHVPLHHLAASRLAAGHLPFWNPYVFSGVPHLADPQTALFYPPATLTRLFPAVWAFTALAFFHLLLAFVGAQLLARRLGAGAASAAALGAAFALSPFTAGRLLQGVPTLLFSLAWVPWCWLALLERRAWLLAGVWALQGLSGHPQFAAMNALAMASWSLAEPRGRGRAFLVGAAGAAALALVQAVPAAELLTRSNRRGLPEAFASAYSMPPRALATLLSPRAFGDPRDGTFAGDPSEWFEEYALSLGLAPLAAAAAGAGSLPAARAGWALAAAGAALAAGSHAPWWALWKDGPLAALSRVPARFGVWTLWGLWLAAALGWARFARSASRTARLGAGVLALAALAEAGRTGASLLGSEDAAAYLAPNRAVAEALGGRLERVLTAPGLPNADKTMMYRLMNVNGYAAYYPARLAEYAFAAEGRPAADPSRLYLATPSAPGVRALGVSAVLPGPGGTPYARVDGAAALARVPGGSASVQSPRPESWRVRGAGPGPLTFAIPECPGWRAWVDGRPAPTRLAEGLFLQVDVPDGPFQADFRYEPPGWTLLCLAAVLAWAAWARAGLVWYRLSV